MTNNSEGIFYLKHILCLSRLTVKLHWDVLKPVAPYEVGKVKAP